MPANNATDPSSDLTIAQRVVKTTALILSHNPSDVTDEHHISEDLSADSLDILEVTMALEEEFQIDISDNDVQSVRTVGDLVALVERILGSGDAGKTVA